jgi:hypothetical protein
MPHSEGISDGPTTRYFAKVGLNVSATNATGGDFYQDFIGPNGRFVDFFNLH